MSQKIVVITGSPRPNGNSEQLAKSFVSAAELLGASVEKYNTAFMKIGNCYACDGCAQTSRCVFDDDFQKIAQSIEQADGIALVCPVYWYTFPAQIKAVIDRLYTYCHGEDRLAGKKFALISCCAESGEDTFTGIRFSFERTVSLLRGKIAGEVLVAGVSEAGAIAQTDGEARAAKLAHEMCL